MKRRNRKSGFTLIELMIVIGILVVLIAMVALGIPAALKMFRNFQCNNNLKNIKTALIAYENDFKRLPDRGGDLFLAKLYLTGHVTDWDVFICPADKAEDGAGFVPTDIEKKCPPPDGKWHEYTEYVDEDYDGEQQESRYFLDKENEWKMSNQSDRTFEPGEISYAAVWNRHGSEDADELEAGGEWKKSYEIKSISSTKRKPVVCDDFESENLKDQDIDTEKDVQMVHDDHINVLYSNGDINTVTDLKTIGEESNLDDFKALRN